MISMTGSALPSRMPTCSSRPWMYCSMTTCAPKRRHSVSAAATSPRVCAIVTPMDEPLAFGLTTQGSSVSSAMVSISSAVYLSARHFAVVT